MTVTAMVLGKLVKTCNLATPFGEQSKPVGKWQCVYSDTLNADNKPTIIGFINQNYLPELQDGEKRFFAIDPADGITEKSNIHLRNDGTVLVGKNRDPSLYTNYFVLYNELKADLDDLKLAYNTHIHGGGTISGSTGVPSTLLSIDFSNIRAIHTKTDG